MLTNLIHSHHNMTCFFSGTDMSELHDNAPNHNYYLSLIVNYKEDTGNNWCAKVAYVTEEKKEGIKKVITSYKSRFNSWRDGKRHVEDLEDYENVEESPYVETVEYLNTIDMELVEAEGESSFLLTSEDIARYKEIVRKPSTRTGYSYGGSGYPGLSSYGSGYTGYGSGYTGRTTGYSQSKGGTSTVGKHVSQPKSSLSAVREDVTGNQLGMFEDWEYPVEEETKIIDATPLLGKYDLDTIKPFAYMLLKEASPIYYEKAQSFSQMASTLIPELATYNMGIKVSNQNLIPKHLKSMFKLDTKLEKDTLEIHLVVVGLVAALVEEQFPEAVVDAIADDANFYTDFALCDEVTTASLLNKEDLPWDKFY